MLSLLLHINFALIYLDVNTGSAVKSFITQQWGRAGQHLVAAVDTVFKGQDCDKIMTI